MFKEVNIVTALRVYREQTGMTQVELAALLGVTQGAIALWERGERKPDIVMLKRLALALNCTADDLLAPIPVEEPADAEGS